MTVIDQDTVYAPLQGTCKSGRLAMRQAPSRVAQGLLDWLDQPFIANSANISGSPTCRSGIDVFGMMDGRVDLVLDGGHCTGPGATTVDVTEPVWRVIKTGAIEESEISDSLQPSSNFFSSLPPAPQPLSPP